MMGAPQTYCTGNQETMELHRHTALETRKRWSSTDILHWKPGNDGSSTDILHWKPGNDGSSTDILHWKPGNDGSSTDILHWKPGNDGAPQTYCTGNCTGNQETMELHRHYTALETGAHRHTALETRK